MPAGRPPAQRPAPRPSGHRLKRMRPTAVGTGLPRPAGSTAPPSGRPRSACERHEAALRGPPIRRRGVWKCKFRSMGSRRQTLVRRSSPRRNIACRAGRRSTRFAAQADKRFLSPQWENWSGWGSERSHVKLKSFPSGSAFGSQGSAAMAAGTICRNGGTGDQVSRRCALVASGRGGRQSMQPRRKGWTTGMPNACTRGGRTGACSRRARGMSATGARNSARATS